MKKTSAPPFYAAVIVINTDGEVLLGKRKEDGIWTSPAGGANEGEMAVKTAVRELFEEAGIAADERFLQPMGASETSNKKLCHRFLYVVPAGVLVTSKLDPDQEVKTWKWFKMDEIPEGLRQDQRRFDSVREGFMKYYGINKSLTESLEKGGKPATVGEVREFGGKQFQKMGNGDWKPYVHAEEKQLQAEQNKNKVVSLTDKLKTKIAEKKEVSASAQHISDLQNQAVVPGQQTRSEKPFFTQVDAAMSHGYDAKDFREVGNFFYDRAQKMAENIAKLEATKQKVDPNFEKIKKINLQMSRAFISQANRIDDRQAKTKAMQKSVMMMGHADAAEIKTSDFAIDNRASQETQWLDRVINLMDGYEYGDTPRVLPMDAGDLHIVKVDDGMYSGVFRRIYNTEDGELVDNAKVRIERLTLPSLVQFCIAKEWIQDEIVVSPKPPMESLVEKLAIPEVNPIVPVMEQTEAVAPEESNLDKKIKVLELLNKLTT